LIALGVVLIIGVITWIVSKPRQEEAGRRGVETVLLDSNGQHATPAKDLLKGQGPVSLTKKGQELEELDPRQVRTLSECSIGPGNE
jgi:hypothetical protein